MKRVLSYLAVLGMMSALIGCAGSGGGTHQTSSPPPPVPQSSDPNARPTIYDANTGGAYTLPKEESMPDLPQATGTSTETMISYTVQPGDSLWKIANTQRSSVAKIRAANNLTGDVIRPGQVLQVPVP
jgi:LysM repeat protein